MFQIALIALVILAYALVAARLERRSISGPIVLVTVGALIGPAGLALIEAPATSEVVQLLAEFTLAILLFTDASTIGLRAAGAIAWLPGRLLGIGLPLTIAVGGLVGWWLFPELGVGFALLLGTILAPTDAALSLPVLLNKAIPVRVRRAINIESGLNDGIASPFVALFIAITIAEETASNQGWLLPAAFQILIAIVVAALVGGLGGRLAVWARARGWASAESESLAVVAMAILAYAAATTIGGNGFVAAFAAGIAFHTATDRAEPSVEFAESLGVSASYLVWLLFGVGMAGPVIAAGFDPLLIGYAILSLTIIRMAPVAIALLRSPLRPDTIAMIGWFGPRGLASVVFLLVAMEELGPSHPASLALVQVVTWTVLLSVFIHGLSAGPVSARYAARITSASPDAWEVGDASEPQLNRRPLLARRRSDAP